MTTIRSYTTIEQSKELAKILPLESADGWWTALNWQETEYYIEVKQDGIDKPKKYIPCWSLAALLGVLPNNEHVETSVSRGGWQIEPINYLPNTWWCEYEDSESLTEFNVSAENPIDACVAMIEKLHKLNLL